MERMIADSWVMGRCRDVNRSVAFYAKFGLKPSMRMPYYAELKVPGGTVLGLHSEHMGRSPRKRSSGGAGMRGWGIMLRVKNIKKTVSDLKRKKVRCGPVKTAPGGAFFSMVSDPDGNRLILIQVPKG
jgi:predicted enzyme related to lactoylglutathione lyase